MKSTENTEHITTQEKQPEIQYLGSLLSRREYFAGLAMQGIVGTCLEGSGMVCDKARAKTVAMCAVEYADALLTELRKEQSREQD